MFCRKADKRCAMLLSRFSALLPGRDVLLLLKMVLRCIYVPLVLPKTSHPGFHGPIFLEWSYRSLSLGELAHREWVSKLIHHVLENRETPKARGGFRTNSSTKHVICGCKHSKDHSTKGMLGVVRLFFNLQQAILTGDWSKPNYKTTCLSGFDVFISKIRWSWINQRECIRRN